MTFSYNLATATGQIRLEIGDTNSATDQGIRPDGTNFTDEELAYFYTAEGSNVLAASARACEVVARLWAGAGESVKIRDYQIDTTKKAGYYASMAQTLRARSGSLFAGGSAPTTKMDGYSNDVNSRENQAAGGSEYWKERKELRWP